MTNQTTFTTGQSVFLTGQALTVDLLEKEPISLYVPVFKLDIREDIRSQRYALVLDCPAFNTTVLLGHNKNIDKVKVLFDEVNEVIIKHLKNGENVIELPDVTGIQ